MEIDNVKTNSASQKLLVENAVEELLRSSEEAWRKEKKHFAKFAHFFLSKDSFLGSQVGPEGKMEPLSLRCGGGKFTLKFAKS